MFFAKALTSAEVLLARGIATIPGWVFRFVHAGCGDLGGKTLPLTVIALGVPIPAARAARMIGSSPTSAASRPRFGLGGVR